MAAEHAHENHGAPEQAGEGSTGGNQKKSCHEILKLEEKLMEVESEWFDACAKLRT